MAEKTVYYGFWNGDFFFLQILVEHGKKIGLDFLKLFRLRATRPNPNKQEGTPKRQKSTHLTRHVPCPVDEGKRQVEYVLRRLRLETPHGSSVHLVRLLLSIF